MKQRPVILLLVGILLFRLAYLPLFCAVTDLAGDESYYWEWGRRPDWSYFSKPPLIGWLMGLVGLATGHAEWGIRLAALGCGTASLWFLQALANRMSGPRAALLTLLLAALTPANAALNLFFTIDAPLVLAWSAALLAQWRCLEEPNRPWCWTQLTLALGFGILAKQMMLVFPLLLLMLLVLTKELRPLLRRAALWWSLALALVFLAPVLWWQQQHQWVTLDHMSHHFDTHAQPGLVAWLARFLSFPASQAGLFTPVTWVLLLGGAFNGLWFWRRLETKERFLVVFSAPALLVFFGLALRQSINPNWPAVYYLSAMVLLAGHLAKIWERHRKLARTTLIVAGIVTLLAYGLPLAIPALGLAGHPKLDPLARLRGWHEAGLEAGRLLAQTAHPQRTFLLALGHRENASQFAFYTPPHPPVYRWQPDGIIASQYELWPSMHERTGWDALILQPSPKPLARSLVKQFASVENLANIRIPLGHGRERAWQVYLAKGLKPQPAAKP